MMVKINIENKHLRRLVKVLVYLGIFLVASISLLVYVIGLPLVGFIIGYFSRELIDWFRWKYGKDAVEIPMEGTEQNAQDVEIPEV